MVAPGLSLSKMLVPNAAFFPKTNLSPEVSVKRDENGEYMDIDHMSMPINKLYLIKYQGETYAIRRTSESKIAFYDVIE